MLNVNSTNRRHASVVVVLVLVDVLVLVEVLVVVLVDVVVVVVLVDVVVLVVELVEVLVVDVLVVVLVVGLGNLGHVDHTVEDLEVVIKANEDAETAAGHWGVPLMVFNGEAMFGQDRISHLIFRLEQAGLKKRG